MDIAEATVADMMDCQGNKIILESVTPGLLRVLESPRLPARVCI